MSFLNNRNAFMCAFNETIGKNSQLEGNTFKISINETIEINPNNDLKQMTTEQKIKILTKCAVLVKTK
jgi:hypothetical protein